MIPTQTQQPIPQMGALGASPGAAAGPSPSLIRPNIMPMAYDKTPAAGVASSQPTPTATSPTANAPQAAPMTPTPSIGYGQTSSFDPSSNLIGTQIAPGAESNRFDLANQQLQTYQNQQLPQFQHDLRSTVQNNAAVGRLGSGMLNTDVGNLDLAQQNNYNNMKSTLLNGALNNQITDNANQRNELRGERDYQSGLQTQAYNQGVQGLTLDDALTNSAFGRGLATEQAGYGSNPADMQAWLSGVYGQQAGQAGQAVSGLIGSTTQNNLLQSILGQQQPQQPNGPVPEVPQSVPNYQIPGIIG